jgi:hypothetical protein
VIDKQKMTNSMLLALVSSKTAKVELPFWTCIERLINVKVIPASPLLPFATQLARETTESEENKQYLESL